MCSILPSQYLSLPVLTAPVGAHVFLVKINIFYCLLILRRPSSLAGAWFIKPGLHYIKDIVCLSLHIPYINSELVPKASIFLSYVEKEFLKYYSDIGNTILLVFI